MFTGIVEELGHVAAVEDLGSAVRLTIHGPIVVADTAPGDSVAVNGACLIAVSVERGVGLFTADVMWETLDRSALGELRPGAPVNLERAATLGSRLGGHLVQGHVDGVGQILSRIADEHWELVRIGVPRALVPYLVEKGSIAVDGVSLSVAAADDDWFSVSLLPATLKATSLGRVRIGDPVNLEVDVVAKHVHRLLGAAAPIQAVAG